MTLEEIAGAKINPEIAREAYAQANARLADVLDSKKVIEQKAQWLFGGYVTLALGSFGVAGAFARAGIVDRWMIALVVTGVTFVAGAVMCAAAQRIRSYAGMGSVPRQWLLPGKIDGADEELPRILAAMTFYRQDEIDKSADHNAEKARWLSRAIWTGAVAPVLFGLLLLQRIY